MGYTYSEPITPELRFSASRVARQTLAAIAFLALLAAYGSSNTSNASTYASAPQTATTTQQK